ncbi:MAG: exodeoxyribonuclease VII small subunit [Lachnospiraceae bacterium]|nr:exodeoxyribonuclease VII small subunit [Lachnospiraceae bacterium]
MAKKKEDFTLEEGFGKLDDILSVMENEKPSLEESFTLYKDGMEILSACKEKIDTVEHKVQELNEDNELIPFDTEE